MCFVHGRSDGLAIGAAFSATGAVGLSTTLAVFLHEVPHEVGDFAILVSQGFSKRSAFLAQFVSASGAFMGCFVGLLLSDGGSSGGGHGSHGGGGAWTNLVLSFTGGGFIYIALVNIMPDLIEHKSSLKQTVLEVLAICAGISLMVLVAIFE